MTFETELVGLRPRLLSYATKLTQCSIRAEDLLQDTFMKALGSRHLFTPGTNLSAWTFTIMRNTFIMQSRRAGRIAEDPDDRFTLSLAVEPNQETRELFRDVLDMISGLSTGMQNSLYEVGLMGETYEDAAEKLGIPIGTVKSQLCRARMKLEDLLA